MTSKRLIVAVLVGITGVVIVVAWASPFPGLFLRLRIEEFFPAMISWDGKTAWKRCDSAIIGRTSWPQSPEAACAAMRLCINEAPLSAPQLRSLSHAIRATPGCAEP
jgi:hypothetical protein